jgi:ATP-dependent DNA helicase RecG
MRCSGMANVEKWLSPEGAVTPQATPQVTEQATEQATEQVEREAKLLEFCAIPRSRKEMQAFLGLADREHFRSSILLPLLEQGQPVPTLPGKPNSPKQCYITIQGRNP